ncbi:hypothetical protein AQUSIP_09510 [Aquicella siphonis]|uniref:Uncharacterized protein n=1 Tax=Aquicella siphonis TaxID=254247 RepID=A0A5E4PH65_9COXI|nr:hypothetical protein [Aquicella siphonis]VVC75661.1 hypothetical protein AQUSIP_09510 [Aquicella siphonis]
MKFKLLSAVAASAVLFSHLSAAEPLSAAGPISQSIQITNLLANTDLQDSTMTQTSVMVSAYNGGKSPCWSAKVDYQNDYTFHVGPRLGCTDKIYQLVIDPIPVGGKLKTYTGPYGINIDVSKFATQIILVQDQKPEFDPLNGMIKTPGTMKAKVQMQLQ